MSTPQFKDVTINEQKFQIGRLSARDGSWILLQVMTKMMPPAIASRLNFGLLDTSTKRSEMSAAEFHEIQDLCIAACRRYEKVGTVETPMPIMARPGVFAIAELENDIVTILALTVHVLLFNISCFFDGKALSQVLDSFQDLNLPDALTSMNFSSDQ